MKNIVIFIFLIGTLFGCTKIQDGCVGNSTFFIKNETDKILVFESISKHFNGKNDSLEIGTNKILKIAEGGDFGYSPRPSNRYSKISIFTFVNSKKSMAFVFNPINDERWIVDIQKRNDSDCDIRVYTLIITQKDIQ